MFEDLIGHALKDRQEQIVHGAEVVMHKLRFQARLSGDAPRTYGGVTLLPHELLGRIQQVGAGLGTLRTDPSRRRHFP